MKRREAVAVMAIGPLVLAGTSRLFAGDARPGGPGGGTMRAGPPAAPLLIVYSTREGQTRRIADVLSDNVRAVGHAVEIGDVGQYLRRPPEGAPLAVLVAASIHFGQHAKEVARFVEKHRAMLERVPTAFLSVSLSAAGPAKRAEAEGYVRAFIEETGWQPDLAQIAPGALRYSQYGLVKRKIMRKIAEDGGLPTDTSQDHEFTDWQGIAAFGDAFLKRVGMPA